MSALALARIEQCQEALIGALDGDDIEILEESIENLRLLVEAARGTGAWRDKPDARERAQRVSALAHAAMVRVNFLTDVTRQRLEALAAIRGRPLAVHYGREGR